jgi:NADH:ubiquinone oxidoreductase subunit 2 (subunit N)
MTMLVDHGLPGAIAYLWMTVWMLLSLRRLRRELRGSDDFLALMLPAVAGSLVAITVGDLFVQYPKLEVRFWLLTIVMAMLSMAKVRSAERSGADPAPAASSVVGSPGVRSA